MTKQEELKLGQELYKTNISLMVRLSKREFYNVYPLFDVFIGIGSKKTEVKGIVINYYYTENRHLEHSIYKSTSNDHPEILRDFEAAVDTNKYEIQRHYINYRER